MTPLITILGADKSKPRFTLHNHVQKPRKDGRRTKEPVFGNIVVYITEYLEINLQILEL